MILSFLLRVIYCAIHFGTFFHFITQSSLIRFCRPENIVPIKFAVARQIDGAVIKGPKDERIGILRGVFDKNVPGFSVIFGDFCRYTLESGRNISGSVLTGVDGIEGKLDLVRCTS